SGQLYEIQIRTRDMHRTAEYGIAAHWLYKENGKTADELDHHLSWFRQLIELQQDAHSPEEFLELLKIDLYQDEIFVFTPKGDVKRLPTGATPIDFALMVHTEVGQHCNGARVNGRLSPLHWPLRNGATIRLITGPHAPPTPAEFGRVIERLRLGRGSKIHGVEGLMVPYAQCCQPVPGDPVVGYVTQGRGISIHRHDCPNLLTLSGDEDRRVEIDWREVE